MEYIVKEVNFNKLRPKKDRPYPPQKPNDRTEAYNGYLLMLRLHVKPYIDLEERTYKALWLDKWDWMSTHHSWLNDYSDDSSVLAAMVSYDIA